MERVYEVLDADGNVLVRGIREEVSEYLSNVMLMCQNFKLTIRDLP